MSKKEEKLPTHFRKVTDGQEFYTPKELASILRFHVSTIYRAVRSHEIPFHVIKGCIRFRRQEIEDFLESCINLR